MFPGCCQDFSRMFSGCSDGSYWPGGIWWSFQMKVWTLMIQRNSMIPNYSMIPAIRWSPAIWWSIRSIDFDNWKVYCDTSITDGLVSSQIQVFTSAKTLLKIARVESGWILELIGVKKRIQWKYLSNCIKIWMFSYPNVELCTSLRIPSLVGKQSKTFSNVSKMQEDNQVFFFAQGN